MAPKGRILNRLRIYRDIHGYSQEQVARLLGMKHANLISEWERGTVAPNLDNLLRLSVLYKTLIEELYFDRLKMHRKAFSTSLPALSDKSQKENLKKI